MLKRVALMFTATAILAIPAAGAFAAPSHPSEGGGGILPDQACLALYPEALQPALCGRGNGGPGHAGPGAG
jgi:hypothetical protein